MSEKAPVFVLSCERSGSTLLRYILDTHPEICCPGELVLGRLIESLAVTVSRLVPEGAPSVAPLASEWVRQRVRGLIGELLAEKAASHGKRLWCDKSPDNTLLIGQLEWAFPDARYLCLYRESNDVAYSCLEAMQLGFVSGLSQYIRRYPSNLVAAMIDSWTDKTERMLQLEAGNLRCHRLRYEDLVADPTGTVDGIFNFLGLDWDRDLLNEVFSAQHSPGGGDYKIHDTCVIETDRVGKGGALSAVLLAAAPPDLRRRRAECHRQLGYPVA